MFPRPTIRATPKLPKSSAQYGAFEVIADINELESLVVRMREASITRNTKETQIQAELRIEGAGTYEISTGIRFLDHMLELFSKHGAFDLKLSAKGDLDVDQHHTVEDVGIVLGDLFTQSVRRSPRHQPRRLLRPDHG